MTFNNEEKILEYFRGIGTSEVAFINETENAEDAFHAVYDRHNSSKWVNSSGKSDPPPDFYSDDLGYMLEVMRVDDHSHKNRKGKLVNPTLARENQLYRELLDSGIIDSFENVGQVFINACTDLSPNEDHNYDFYRSNFVRTIDEHKRKIDLYKENHPNLRIIFFVMDESSAYILPYGQYEIDKLIAEKAVEAKIHYFWADEAFVNSIKCLDIDFLIWFSPFKVILSSDAMVDLPKVCVYDVKNIDIETIEYNEQEVISIEL